MNISGNTLLVLAAIFFFGMIIPQLFKRFHLSFAASIILLGSILGPYGLKYVEQDETMTIFGFLGAAFHMMLVGFEAKTLHIRDMEKKVLLLVVLNILFPFFTGFIITRLFDYSWVTSFFMGFVFISSSIMMVFTNVKMMNIGKVRMGKTLKSIVVLQDLVSAFLIFLVFKRIEPHSRFELPILLGLLISSVVILRMFIPEFVAFFFQRFERSREVGEAKIQLVISILFVVLLIYSSLDVNPIIAAFLCGFVISGTPKITQVKAKLNTIGYAMFIPIYLFIIGVKLDLTILTEFNFANYLLISIVVGVILSKMISGYFGGKLAGFSSSESLIIGISSTTKLTVATTSAFAALSLGLIDNNLYSAIILLTVITIILNPILISFIIRKTKHG